MNPKPKIGNLRLDAQSSRGGHIAFIHSLRGIAILLVLCAHLGGWWLTIAGKQSILQTTWINLIARPFRLYQDGGHLGVLLFFLVSGYIITHVSLRETRREFIIKRVFRLVPSLWIAIALIPILRLLSDAFSLPDVMGNESQDYFSGLIFLNYITGTPQVLTVLWTLFIELLFYAFTAGFINMSRARPLLATWLMLGGVLVVFMAAQLVPLMNQLMWSVMYIPFLVLGRCFFLTINGILRKADGALACAASYGIFLLVFSNTAPGRLMVPGGEAIVSHAIAVLLFLGLCFSGISRNWRPLSFVADTSYPVYLFHAPLGGFCLYLLTDRGLSYEGSLAITVTIVMAFSFAVFKLVELPVQRVVRRFLKRKQRLG